MKASKLLFFKNIVFFSFFEFPSCSFSLIKSWLIFSKLSTLFANRALCSILLCDEMGILAENSSIENRINSLSICEKCYNDVTLHWLLPFLTIKRKRRKSMAPIFYYNIPVKLTFSWNCQRVQRKKKNKIIQYNLRN